MSSSVCSFKDCYTTKRKYPNLHLFRFPWKDEERCVQWIENSGCSEALKQLTTKSLSGRGVCALHFEQESFMNYLCNSLTKSAVPVPRFINPELLVLLETNRTRDEIHRELLSRDPKIQAREHRYVACEPEPAEEQSVNSPTNTTTESDPLDTVDNVPTKEGCQVGKWGEVKSAVNMTPRTDLTRQEIVEAMSKFMSGPAHTLFKMQILRSGIDDNTGDEWAVEEKELALTMYYKSSSLYKYLRDRQILMLPSDADIQHWINCTSRARF